jgi:hypothetical protein
MTRRVPRLLLQLFVDLVLGGEYDSASGVPCAYSVGCEQVSGVGLAVATSLRQDRVGLLAGRGQYPLSLGLGSSAGLLGGRDGPGPQRGVYRF